MSERSPPPGADDADEALATARLLLELSREVSGSLGLQDVLDRGIAALRRLVPFEGGSIQLVSDGALRLAATDPPATPEAYEFRLPLGQGLGGRIAVTGEPIYCADAATDPRVNPEGRTRASSGVRSYFGAPLVRGGEIIGVVQLDSPVVDAFSPRQQASVLAFVPTIAAAVQNAQLYEREVAALDELRDAEAAKSDFLATISHELRTPVTSLIGFSETLSRFHRKLDDERIDEITGWMVQRSRGLMRLIEDLLDVTALERGKLTVIPALVDTVDLIMSWADLCSNERLRIELQSDLPPVLVDVPRMRQVLDNLLSNAAKFSPSHTEIVVRVCRDGDRVIIEVVDRGRGIPRELQARIFDRFFQVEHAPNRTTGGLGVGLYLVRLLCELMDATVELESEPGRGTTVRIGLRGVEKSGVGGGSSVRLGRYHGR